MEFLQKIIPTGGETVLLGLPSAQTPDNLNFPKSIWTNLTDGYSHQGAVNQLIREHRDIYFAPSCFNERTRRQACVKNIKSLWLDIDAGETKVAKHGPEAVYASSEDAVGALVNFTETTGFPSPTYVVMSGMGFHVYWALQTPISAEEWRKYARALGRITSANGLKVDPSRTVDSASVLRLPNTTHMSSGNTVSILSSRAVYDNQVIYQALSNYVDDDPFSGAQHLRAGTSIMDGMVRDYAPKSFKKIIYLHKADGGGCSQINHAYQNQNNVSYDIWRGVLSIAQNCSDGVEWIHEVSKNYSQYSPEETEKRALETEGKPFKCETFDLYNPGGCEGCPHKGKIVSPISLGSNPDSMPVQVTVPAKDENRTPIQYIIPELPHPFYRPANGKGIWYRYKGKTDDGEETIFEEELFDNDFYLYDRLENPGSGTVEFLARLHLPHDGVREFFVSAENISNPTGDKTKAQLANQNILLLGKEYNMLGKYLNKQAKRLIADRAAGTAPAQNGWQQDGSFVWGTTRYTMNGPVPCATHKDLVLKQFSDSTSSPRGSLEDWSRLLFEMYGGEDAGAHRMQMAILLGAPIAAMAATDTGGVVNAYSNSTGQGKTFAYLAAFRGLLSFDNTDAPMLCLNRGTTGATGLALLRMMGHMNSLPVLWDEVSSVGQDKLGEIVYAASEGRGRMGMQQSGTEFRGSVLPWKSVLLSTANKSILQTISGYGQSEAQMARVFEFQVSIPAALDASRGASIERLESLKREFNGIGGVLAPVYFDYLVKNKESVKALWAELHTEVSRALNVTTQERFITNIAVQAILFAKLAYENGWWKFTPMQIFQEVAKHFGSLRSVREDLQVTDEDILASFFNNNLDGQFVYRENGSQFTNIIPRKHVTHRVEIESGLIFINTSKLLHFCRSRSLDIKRVEHYIESMGGTRTKCRLLQGASGDSSSRKVACWVIDTKDPRASKYNTEDLADISTSGDLDD